MQVLLTGLKPSTRYYYQIRNGQVGSQWSNTREFYSPPLSESSEVEPVEGIVYGDLGARLPFTTTFLSRWADFGNYKPARKTIEFIVSLSLGVSILNASRFVYVCWFILRLTETKNSQLRDATPCRAHWGYIILSGILFALGVFYDTNLHYIVSCTVYGRHWGMYGRFQVQTKITSYAWLTRRIMNTIGKDSRSILGGSLAMIAGVK